MRLEAANVEDVFRDCLYTDEECPDLENPPADMVRVKGIIGDYGFHSGRLEGHRADVAAMLEELPSEFHKGEGGGWSFLNACMTRDGEQWTGLHQTMGWLFGLAIGLGLAEFVLPHEMWSVLPGGMPYIIVDTQAIRP